MLREDASGRFDYLFEPLEADDSAGDGDDAAVQALTQTQDDSPWARRIVLTGVVLATLAAAAATAVVMRQPALPAQHIVTPTDATPMSTPESTATSPALPPRMPATTTPPAPATVSTSVGRPPSAARPVLPQQPPSSTAGEPPATMPPPPTTRAPMSVSPETRTPFPNQTPQRRNDGGGGGLLGGLL